MKEPRIADFRDKITLCRLTSTVDSELNRTYNIVPVQTVWAVVTVKSSSVEETNAGFRPEITYSIVIRRQEIVCDCIMWNGKVLKLTKPVYPLDTKYIQIEAVEIDGFPAKNS